MISKRNNSSLPTSHSSLLLIFAIAAMLIVLPACRRTSHNGKIDGQWKIQEITMNATGETIYPADLHIDINLELLQLRGVGEPYHLTGVISYSKDDRTLGVDFRFNPTLAELEPYGIYSNPVVFGIPVLTTKKLVLKTPESTITCKRF